MLTRLLAADPTTPADVLTYLADRALCSETAQVLAAHPNLPPTAPLNVPMHSHRALNAALTNPRIPAARRTAFIDAGLDTVAHIGAYDDFTPDELTHIYDLYSADPVPGRWERVNVALARNARTPAPIAAKVVDYLYRSGSHAVLADATALRHHLTPATPAAQAAAAHPDAGAAYARHLLASSAPDYVWWRETINAFPHPVLTAGALATAATSTTVLREGIDRAVAANPRVTPEHRYRAVLRTPSLLPYIEDVAPDEVLRALIPHTERQVGRVNPNVTDATLRVIFERVQHDPALVYTHPRLALHPAAAPALRRDIVAAAPLAHPWLGPVVDQIIAGEPGALLDVRHTVLASVEDDPTHWIQPAWDRHHRHSPATLDYARATLALAAAGFTGTLRELLAAARGISA